MKYFIVSQDKNYKNPPRLRNWFQNYDSNSLHDGAYENLPDRQMFYIDPSAKTSFLDILAKPFFICSQKAKDVISLFEPNLKYREVVLVDKENQTVNQYFLPELELIDCVDDETKQNLNRQLIENGTLLQDDVGQKALFRIDDVQHTYVVIRLDLVEALLRRDITGMVLTEMLIQEEAVD